MQILVLLVLYYAKPGVKVFFAQMTLEHAQQQQAKKGSKDLSNLKDMSAETCHQNISYGLQKKGWIQFQKRHSFFVAVSKPDFLLILQT